MKDTFKDVAKNQLGALVGTLIYTVGVNLFIVPSGVYSGGMMGVCQLLRNLILFILGKEMGGSDIAGIIYYALNVPVFIAGIIVLGKRYMASTIITVSAMSLFLSVIPILQTPIMQDDVLASSIVGGALAGCGIGLVLRYKSTMGGMDIISLFIMKKYNNISMGKIYLTVNIVVYGICMILYSPRIAIYSLIYAVVSSTVMDRIFVLNPVSHPSEAK